MTKSFELIAVHRIEEISSNPRTWKNETPLVLWSRKCLDHRRRVMLLIVSHRKTALLSVISILLSDPPTSLTVCDDRSSLIGKKRNDGLDQPSPMFFLLTLWRIVQPCLWNVPFIATPFCSSLLNQLISAEESLWQP